jgi:hypothetical protein
VTVTSGAGHFTRQGLVDAFVKSYEDIYATEAAAGEQAPYGIWTRP